jgi:hypothetical protein
MPRHRQRERSRVNPVRPDANPSAPAPGSERDIAPEGVHNQSKRGPLGESPQLSAVDEGLIGRQPKAQSRRRCRASVRLGSYFRQALAEIRHGHLSAD